MYAKVWEDNTLRFFSVTVPQAKAKSLVRKYVRESGYNGPAQTSSITEDVNYHALALNGNNGQKIVKVMNTDTAFRLFLLNTTDDTQLTSLLQGTALQILRPFPAGLSTDVGIVIANPVFGDAPVYARNWTTAAYHGTVVWGWPMAMLAKGLEHQLGRCETTSSAAGNPQAGFVPAFCAEKKVFDTVRKAYNHLWDLIEQNRPQLSSEVWSWKYDWKAGMFKEVDLGVLSATGEF